jgi:hypothetical protein
VGGSEREWLGDLVEHRIGTVLTAASQHRTAVGIDELSALMPAGGPAGRGEVAEWLASHPSFGHVIGDRVTGPVQPAWPDSAERRSRGIRYLAEARFVVEGPLAAVGGLVECVAVTGSAAYGEPARHDDLDFLVVTRRGSVWPFLLYTYLAARLRPRKPNSEGPSHWCFNYILDDRVARQEFGAPRGFLFAREALMARAVAGESYYRGLVGSATWLSEEVPRLYERWKSAGLPPLPAERPASLPIRMLNAALFPVMAWYLTLASLVRNRRLIRSGRHAKRFRVVARIDRLAYETRQFDELQTLYSPATAVARAESP